MLSYINTKRQHLMMQGSTLAMTDLQSQQLEITALWMWHRVLNLTNWNKKITSWTNIRTNLDQSKEVPENEDLNSEVYVKIRTKISSIETKVYILKQPLNKLSSDLNPNLQNNPIIFFLKPKPKQIIFLPIKFQIQKSNVTKKYSFFFSRSNKPR